MNKGVFLQLIIACLVVLIHPSCTQTRSALDAVLDRGELVVLTRADPTTYIVDENGASGFEHALVTLFAKKLGVNARFILPADFKSILKITPEHEADFSAAGLSVTEERKKTLLFTPPYYEVTQQLIYHQRLRRPKSISQIDSPFFDVLSGSSHAENLARLKTGYPQLTWGETNNSNNFELVSMVNEGLLDYTIADSNQFRIFQARLHQLHAAFKVSKPEKIAWAFPISEDHSLYDEAVSFINELKQNGTLQQLQDQYFGFSKSLNYVGICTFRRHIKSRLPSLTPFLHEAAKTYGLDWRLLAATAYQESHWNPQAVSPTGVRGVMMLTNATAKQLNIENRVDPAQSIQGGANYLSSRID
jgi:membrane-bound lytic murein transglycosylase F